MYMLFFFNKVFLNLPVKLDTKLYSPFLVQHMKEEKSEKKIVKGLFYVVRLLNGAHSAHVAFTYSFMAFVLYLGKLSIGGGVTSLQKIILKYENKLRNDGRKLGEGS
jgi:hypothetical protein